MKWIEFEAHWIFFQAIRTHGAEFSKPTYKVSDEKNTNECKYEVSVQRINNKDKMLTRNLINVKFKNLFISPVHCEN